MNERELFDQLLGGWFVLSLLVVIALQFLSAPYGRHTRDGWGPQIPAKLGWVIMELPAVVTHLVLFALSDRAATPVTITYCVLWQLHYFNRTFVYPFRVKSNGKTMPLVIALTAVVTNVGVSYLIGRWLYTFGPERGAEWLADPRFMLGLGLFALGFAINVSSDEILMNLRKPGETGYKIPVGGAYRWLSCPNYFGEILEWSGYALLTWSLPALGFVVWTMANLVPRALTHHAWYREKFDDYPAERSAIIPYLL